MLRIIKPLAKLVPEMVGRRLVVEAPFAGDVICVTWFPDGDGLGKTPGVGLGFGEFTGDGEGEDDATGDGEDAPLGDGDGLGLTETAPMVTTAGWEAIRTLTAPSPTAATWVVLVKLI